MIERHGAPVFLPAIAWWERQTLFARFTMSSSVVLIAGMIVTGLWIANRITEGVIHSAAISAALFADSIIEPAALQLVSGGTITTDRLDAISALLRVHSEGSRIVGIRIWVGDTIVYSDRQSVIGQSFPSSKQRSKAWAGQLAVSYRKSAGGEELGDVAFDQPLLEIYAPVRRPGSQEIVALAETYHALPSLAQDIWTARAGSWLVIGLIAFAIAALQTIIVRSGSRTIETQRAALNARINDLSRLVLDNEALQMRATRATARVSEVNERYLRRISAEIHDGPIQLIGMSVMRLDTLVETLVAANITLPPDAEDDVAITHEALRDCLLELRQMSYGLAAPEIDNLSPAAALELAAVQHERRTGSTVDVQIGISNLELTFGAKLCLFRVVQEGLNNAYRHAAGIGQAVSALRVGDDIVVSVCDRGQGFSDGATEPGRGLGLSGLRDRVEAMGGRFSITNRPEGGTCMTVSLSISTSLKEEAHA